MRTEEYFLSYNQKNQIHKVIWQPEGEIKGILQLVHGMSEYILRYDEFAQFLNQQGYLVVGHDHLGHGLSVETKEDLGYFTEKNAPEILVADVYQVLEATQANFPELPYMILGHSMGSFVTRVFLQHHSNDVDGAIIMGTSGPRPEVEAILPILKTLAKTAGKKRNEKINDIAFGQYAHFFNDTFAHPSNWLSKSITNVEAYAADEYMGFTFTNNGFHTLFTLLHQGTKKGWSLPISRNLPIMIIHGEQDPVGQFGKGPRKVVSELLESGFQDVTYQNYEHLRHEILNEDIVDRQLVYHDILRWLDKKIVQ